MKIDENEVSAFEVNNSEVRCACVALNLNYSKN